ncbi:hypothetical protein Tco_0222753 [Tanacetum coccineum]
MNGASESFEKRTSLRRRTVMLLPRCPACSIPFVDEDDINLNRVNIDIDSCGILFSRDTLIVHSSKSSQSRDVRRELAILLQFYWENYKPTPDRVLKSPSSFPIPVADSDSFLEESDTSLSHFDNSLLPELENFSDHTEETKKWQD